MKADRRSWVGVGALAVLVLAGGVLMLRRPKPPASVAASEQVALRQPESVAALGSLRPAGEVRRLAAPTSGFGGSPRSHSRSGKGLSHILSTPMLAELAWSIDHAAEAALSAAFTTHAHSAGSRMAVSETQTQPRPVG